MIGAVLLLPLCAFMAWTGTPLPLPFNVAWYSSHTTVAPAIYRSATWKPRTGFYFIDNTYSMWAGIAQSV
jgi:hypothetical protein